jgi:hypothetical protein
MSAFAPTSTARFVRVANRAACGYRVPMTGAKSP